MKIIIRENPEQTEMEVVIHCKTADEDVQNIVSALRAADKKLTGIIHGRTYLIDPRNVLYFDTVDKKTFIYTAQAVYETELKLYELEILSPSQFFRASKSAVINIAKIKNLMPDFGSRLTVTLQNGERLSVSRQYANEFKSKLGI